MSKTDRITRAIVGLGVIGAGVYLQNWWGVIGLVPLSTAIIAVCPAYLPFSISSCKID